MIIGVYPLQSMLVVCIRNPRWWPSRDHD